MVQLKGGGGSIRVGTTGTISSLMTRELESMKIPSHHHNQSSPSSSRRRSLDTEPSRSNSTSFTTQQVSGVKKPNKSHKSITTAHRIQLLGPEENNRMSFDTTPIREKRGPTIVEIVDIKCGTSEANRAWTVPITSRLRKLGFSKLSDHNNNNIG